MAYRIYTEVNFADTSRDPDDIHIDELCYKQTKKDAIKYCKKYITKHFFRKDTDLHKNKDGYSAIDLCSYGKKIIIKKIKIEGIKV